MSKKKIALSRLINYNDHEYVITEVARHKDKIIIEAMDFEIYKSRYKVTQPFGEGTSYWTEEDIHKMIEDMIA